MNTLVYIISVILVLIVGVGLSWGVILANESEEDIIKYSRKKHEPNRYQKNQHLHHRHPHNQHLHNQQMWHQQMLNQNIHNQQTQNQQMLNQNIYDHQMQNQQMMDDSWRAATGIEFGGYNPDPNLNSGMNFCGRFF